MDWGGLPRAFRIKGGWEIERPFDGNDAPCPIGNHEPRFAVWLREYHRYAHARHRLRRVHCRNATRKREELNIRKAASHHIEQRALIRSAIARNCNVAFRIGALRLRQQGKSAQDALIVFEWPENLAGAHVHQPQRPAPSAWYIKII